MTSSKKARTVLCLGPPHSGKSVFGYILFRSLRARGNEACVMDADYYSPTYRRVKIEEFASQDEIAHIITTPNAVKLTKLKEQNFRNLAHAIHDAIEHEGIVVLDGLGRHSSSTEALLELADMLVVLCPNQFSVNNAEAKQCLYVKDRINVHPFDFYRGRGKKYIRIKTHFHNEKKAYFDECRLEGELFDLDRDIIHQGNIDRIPAETRETILQIADFILRNWI